MEVFFKKKYLPYHGKKKNLLNKPRKRKELTQFKVNDHISYN